MSRTKYSERFCGHCNKTTRMEVLGGMQNAEDKVWFRCTRCHHSSLFDLKLDIVETADAKLDATTATTYSPQMSFKVGESIFHSEWNDLGKVMSKTRTSDGTKAIVVSFEKQGQRTLIENLKPEA